MQFKIKLALALVFVFVLTCFPNETFALPAGVIETENLERDYEPVIFEGEMLYQFSEALAPLDQLYAYAFIDGDWRQIVLQVDERDPDDDYFKTDNYFELLDDNDEVVFNSFELGDRVDASTWLAGADSAYRYEVEVVDGTDPLKKGWAYFYIAQGIERDTTDYIHWSGIPTLELTTKAYFNDTHDGMHHVMEGLFILESWGGTNVDLVDRMKMRNKLLPIGSPITEEDVDLDYKHTYGIDGQVRYIIRYWTTFLELLDIARITCKNYQALNVVETNVLKSILPINLYMVKQYFDFDPERTGMIHYDNGGTDPNGDYNKDIIDGLGGGNPNDREPVMDWYEVDHPTAGSWVLISDLAQMQAEKKMRYYNDAGYVGGGDTGDGWQMGESGYEGRWVRAGSGYEILSWSFCLPPRTEAEGPYGPELWDQFNAPLEFSASLQSYTVGIEEGDNFPRVAQHATLGAKPNPFNPVTTIEFTIPENSGGPGSLHVFDITGSRVKTLFNKKHMVPGTHSVTWHGRSDGGRMLAAGVYILKLSLPDSSIESRIVLCK